MKIGSAFGAKFKSKAELIGGTILILYCSVTFYELAFLSFFSVGISLEVHRMDRTPPLVSHMVFILNKRPEALFIE